MRLFMCMIFHFGFFIDTLHSTHVNETSALTVNDEKNDQAQRYLALVAKKIPATDNQHIAINGHELTTTESICAFCLLLDTKQSCFDTTKLCAFQQEVHDMTGNVDGVRSCSLCGYSAYIESEKEKYATNCCPLVGYSDYSKNANQKYERRCCSFIGYHGPEGCVTCLGGKVNGYCFSPCSISSNSDKGFTLLTCLFIAECLKVNNDEENCFLCCPGFITSSPGVFPNSKECLASPCYVYSEGYGQNHYGSCCLFAPMIHYENDADEVCWFFNFGHAKLKDFSCAMCIPFFAEYKDDTNSAGYCLTYGYNIDKNIDSECSCCCLFEHFKNRTFKHGLQCAGLGCGKPRDEEVAFCQLSLCHHPLPRLLTMFNFLRCLPISIHRGD